MAIARSKEGPRAPLFYAALVLANAALAGAQTVEMSELDRCAALESQAEKLACFEALVSAPQPDAGTTREPEPASAKPPVADTDTGPALIIESAPVAAEAAPAPEPSASVDDEFGREHLSREADDADVLHATVVDVTKDRYGALIFRLDNGQIWRQMESRYFPYPKDGEFEVVITTGMMGEYRLQVEGTGRKVTIRRMK